MFPNGGGDLVHVCTGFRSKGSEVGGQFNALETVKVGFHLNGFDVQFFGQQVVEFTEVWASDDPSLSARQPLAAASVNADAAAASASSRTRAIVASSSRSGVEEQRWPEQPPRPMHRPWRPQSPGTPKGQSAV